MSPDGDVTIEVVPGATPQDLLEHFRQLIKTSHFRRIIVHVGTNLIPVYHVNSVANIIIDCMRGIKKLSPNSKIAWSSILPKFSDSVLGAINMINYRVFMGGQIGPKRVRFGAFNHLPEFMNSRGRVNPRYFMKDGIHLSVKGSEIFNRSLKGLVDMA